MDNTLCRLVEPGAAIADERFRALRECKNAGCHTHVLLTPVLPYLNDSMENLESIYFHASEVRVNGISAWPLNLRGSTRKQFFGFLRLYFPHLQKLYEQLFVNGSVDKEYSAALKQKVKGLHQKYGLPEIKLPEIPQPEFIQLTLF
jgi:DNA repair photolyase